MDSLFEDSADPTPNLENAPLAERMRPETLDGYIGQKHLLGAGKALRVAIEGDQIPSMILWGPPGVGKTTLARIVARMTESTFLSFSAVLSGIKELRGVMSRAEVASRQGRKTILFVDEIHRFNKAQQDAFLPYVEKGSIILIGATTENPSFEVIAALLSRVRVFVLEALTDDEIRTLVVLAAEKNGFSVLDDAVSSIVNLSNGDARTAYNILEMASQSVAPEVAISSELIQEVAQRKVLLYDKGGEEHYNIISALHKSIRNSDADASLYWLARMLEAGEDPLYVVRRLVRFASEDIGLANPAALRVSLDTKESISFLGMPEAGVALAQCVIYLAASPKSNSAYTAYSAVTDVAKNSRAEPVPLHLRNAPTRLMDELDYGKGYQYAHDVDGGVADMDCLPESLSGRQFYKGRQVGRETEIVKRLEEFKKLRKKSPE
jgi:putative ATPase